MVSPDVARGLAQPAVKVLGAGEAPKHAGNGVVDLTNTGAARSTPTRWPAGHSAIGPPPFLTSLPTSNWPRTRVDLKSAAGREVLNALVASADVLVTNYGNGVPAKLGFGYEQLSEVNPSPFDGGDATYAASPPRVGEHTTEILDELRLLAGSEQGTGGAE